MKKFIKRVFLFLLILLAAVLLAAVVLFTWLTITEYRPEAEEAVTVRDNVNAPLDKQEFTILSWNVGYCALGEESEFFMDGGDEVRPDSEDIIRKNYGGVLQTIRAEDPDFLLLQEVDSDSKRSYNIDEAAGLRKDLGLTSSFALNFKCNYVPYPLPTIGKVNSGLLSMSRYEVTSATRISLPCPFSWPVSVANLKRCLLVERIPIEGSDKQLVLVNLHLEAYDDGEGKLAQSEQLRDFLVQEYEAGNYVIAGGDWNQVFPDTLELFPNEHPDLWEPGVLAEGDLAAGWRYVWDPDTATCRLLNQPYDPKDTENTQYYIIDGYMVSPNVEVLSVETLELDFVNSDHNPVRLTVRLGE